METFGTDHMALIRPLPGDEAELRRSLDRWLTVAWPALQAWTSGYLSRFDLDRDDQADAFSSALMALHQKLRQGTFEASPRRSDRSLLAVTWRRLLIDWGRAWSRKRRGRLTVAEDEGEGIDVVAFREGVERSALPETPEETVARLEEEPTSAEIDAELGRWRDWPVTAIPLVTTACEACPDDVEREDVERACSKSRVETRGGVQRVLGWSRSADETWSLLEPWLKDYSAWRAAGNLAPKAQHSLQLAFILRGPPGVLVSADWSEDARDKARLWLYQQRSRTAGRLTKRLGVRRGANDE